MLKTVSFSALQAGEQVEVSPGDTLEVVVGFQYLVGEPTTVELWLSLVIPPGRDYTIKQQELVEPAGGAGQWSGSILMPITTGLGLSNSTYDLWFEMPYQTSEVAKAEGAVVVTGITGGIGGIMSIIPLMVVMMMMSMIMPMMEEGEGEVEGGML